MYKNPTFLQVTSGYDSIYQHSIDKPEVFWADRAKEHLHWEQPFHIVVEGNLQSGIKWFSGGKINASGEIKEDKWDEFLNEKSALICTSSSPALISPDTSASLSQVC